MNFSDLARRSYLLGLRRKRESSPELLTTAHYDALGVLDFEDLARQRTPPRRCPTSNPRLLKPRVATRQQELTASKGTVSDSRAAR